MCACKGTAPVTSYANAMAEAQKLVSQQPNQYQQFLGWVPGGNPFTNSTSDTSPSVPTVPKQKENPHRVCDPPELILDESD